MKPLAWLGNLYSAIAAAVSAHVAVSDPHTQYQKESEKSAASGYASLDGSGKVPTAELPSLPVAAHASTHNAGGGDAMAIDAAAATGSLRTLGTAATAACAGNDSRLSDSRTPTAHASTHNAGGADAIDAVVIRSVNDFRLTLESGVAVSTTDQLAKTTIYLTPCIGKQIGLWDGANWKIRETAELSLGVTTTRTGTTSNGSAVITALAKTTDLVVGQAVTGTGIAANSVIASIDSASQVTLDKNATADGTGISLTFKCPATKCYDLFVLDISGTPTLVYGPVWTNTTTPATPTTQKDGVDVLSGAFSIGGTSYAEGRLRHVGSLMTTTTAGQTESSGANRFISSHDNQAQLQIKTREPIDQWTYGTATWREINGGTTSTRFNFIACRADIYIHAIWNFWAFGTNAAFGSEALGLDSTTTPTSILAGGAGGVYATIGVIGESSIPLTQQVGSRGAHYVACMEKAYVGTFTGIGDNGDPTTIESGLNGFVMG
jgi:hypothetical protein